MQVLIISDTHSFLDPRLIQHIKKVDEVWHAGDIGDISVMDEISKLKPLIGVHGNIDNQTIRSEYKKEVLFDRNGKKIYITHIANYPGTYNKFALNAIKKYKPDLFICGHSHILKVMFDKQNNHLHINPGAAGKHGFHAIQTAIKLTIPNAGPFKDLEIIELKR